MIPTRITPKEILSTIDEVAKQTGQESFVLFGSSSAVAFNQHRYKSLPDFLQKTVDIDIVATFKGRSHEWNEIEQGIREKVFDGFGIDSDFSNQNNRYVELVQRDFVRIAPICWEDRTKLITTEQGTKISVLNPIDCAALKLEAGREKDVEWIANGFSGKLFTPKQLGEHVKGHARYKGAETKIAETLAAAVKRSKELSNDRGR